MESTTTIAGSYQQVIGRPPESHHQFGRAFYVQSDSVTQTSSQASQSATEIKAVTRPVSGHVDMDLVIADLDNVGKLCENMIKMFQGIAESVSDISQSTEENISVVETQAVRPPPERQYNPPPVHLIVDLTSESSSESINDKEDGEIVDCHMQGSIVGSRIPAVNDATSPPSTFIERKQPDPLVEQCHPSAQVISLLSDDEDDIQYEPYVRDTSQGQNDMVPADDLCLDGLWHLMGVLVGKPGNGFPVAEETRPRKKRRKGGDKSSPVKSFSVVLHSEGVSNAEGKCPTYKNGLGILEPNDMAADMNYQENDHCFRESTPLLVKRGPGRPRKDKTSQLCAKEPKENQADVALNVEKAARPQERKGEVLEVQEQGRDAFVGSKLRREEQKEEEEEEEEEKAGNCNSAEKSSKEEADLRELRLITSRLHGEKVGYEPYVWRPMDDKVEKGSELDEIWQEMALVEASTSELYPQKSETCGLQKDMKCEHVDIDHDEEMGPYCIVCGLFGDEIKASLKKDCEHRKEARVSKAEVGKYCEDCGLSLRDIQKDCRHKNLMFASEAGCYCHDCGLVGVEIQNLFVPTISVPVRKRVNLEAKGYERAVGFPKFSLQVGGCYYDEDPFAAGLELELHPYYQEHLHLHQKEGFSFLTKNLLGDKQGQSMGCIMAHAPGTGKTCLMISFIQSFLTRFPEGRPVILAPKIMLASWESEFQNWKVDDIPIYNLSACTHGGSSQEYDHGDTVEGYAQLPPHMKDKLKQNRAKVLQEWQGGRGVLLMSYNLFSQLIKAGLNEKVLPEHLEFQMCRVLLDAPDLVVLDEGHLARTKKTNILKSLMKMRSKRRVLLSGTLFQNNFKELYTLLKLCREDFMTGHPEYSKQLVTLCGITLPKSKNHVQTWPGSQTISKWQQCEENIFTRDFGEPLENYVKNGVGSPKDLENINDVVQKLRSLTASFVHWYPGKILESLPGLVEYSVHLNLTEIQQKVISGLPSGPQVKFHMSRQCMVLGACLHPVLVSKSDHEKSQGHDKLPEKAHGAEKVGRYFPNSLSKADLEQEAHQGCKMAFILGLLELCLKAKEKLLIFCSTLGPLRYLEELLNAYNEWKDDQHIVRLDGTMGENDRQAVISRFNAKQHERSFEPYVLLASTKACKEGITLVGASRVVILDNPDNPSVVRQAVSRAFRIGQKRKVYVYRLVTNNKEEEEVFKRSVSKERLSKVLLDRGGKSMKKDDFLQLLTPSDVEDELLLNLMQRDVTGTINCIYKYNASGFF